MERLFVALISGFTVSLVRQTLVLILFLGSSTKWVERFDHDRFGSLGLLLCSFLPILCIHVRFGICTREKGLNMDAQDRQDDIQGPLSVRPLRRK